MSRRIVRRVLERNIEERYRAGAIGTEDALHLFDELLQDAGPSSVRAINCLLYVVGRDRPALGVSLFNRVARAKVPRRSITYNILVGCCRHAGRLDLGFAAMGNIIKLGFSAEAMVAFNHLLRAICAENKTSYAMDIALRRMPEFNCIPNVFSYSVLLKGLCVEKRSQEALELIHMMADAGGLCEEVVRIFKKMSGNGVQPDITTYNIQMDYLCKSGRCEEARAIFDSMAGKVQKPNVTSYSILLHGFPFPTFSFCNVRNVMLVTFLSIATKDALRKGANKFLNLVMTVMNAQITGASNADVLGRHAVSSVKKGFTNF
ncbi:hypothetical protein ZWY2020_016166 [Hordeum vulgare]|nr:hypothetical protein ZWY2020_016166 [Hordeum vulgare]